MATLYDWKCIVKRLKASLNGLSVDFEIISMFIINTRASVITVATATTTIVAPATIKREPYHLYSVYIYVECSKNAHARPERVSKRQFYDFEIRRYTRNAFSSDRLAIANRLKYGRAKGANDYAKEKERQRRRRRRCVTIEYAKIAKVSVPLVAAAIDIEAVCDEYSHVCGLIALYSIE